jgi:hypothetical protein
MDFAEAAADDQTLRIRKNESLRRWIDGQRERVHARVADLLREVAEDDQQRRLFLRALPDLHRRTQAGAFSPAVHLPLLCCSAAGGAEDEAVALAVTTSVLELAMDLLDHEWDGETSTQWSGEDQRLISAAAITLMVGVVPLALARAAVQPARAAPMQRLVAERLLRISAGQMLDLRLFGERQPTLADAYAAAVGKTGERRALYAALGAMLAGAAPEVVAAYDDMGRQYGVARQIASDLADVLVAEHSRDLVSGARTWPIVWMINRVDGAERAELVDWLDRARTDPAAVKVIGRLVSESGAELRGLLEVEQHSRAALAALERAQPGEPAATALRAALFDVSLRGLTAGNAR